LATQKTGSESSSFLTGFQFGDDSKDDDEEDAWNDNSEPEDLWFAADENEKGRRSIVINAVAKCDKHNIAMITSACRGSMLSDGCDIEDRSICSVTLEDQKAKASSSSAKNRQQRYGGVSSLLGLIFCRSLLDVFLEVLSISIDAIKILTVHTDRSKQLHHPH
jgi:hypothetical protein